MASETNSGREYRLPFVVIHWEEPNLLVRFDGGSVSPEEFREVLEEAGDLFVPPDNAVLIRADGHQPGWSWGIMMDEALACLSEGECTPLVAIYDERFGAYVVVTNYRHGYGVGELLPDPTTRSE